MHYNEKEKILNLKILNIILWTPNEISILITDSNGYKVPFETSAVPIFVTLHFR